jgi:cytochrome P450
MTDRELRDELVTLLVAGDETTSTALEWVLERILAHPAIHARLLDDLAASGARRRDDCGGTYVAPCVYLAHRRAESWPDPGRFQPSDSSVAPAAARRSTHTPGSPSAAGARRCIGMAFALLEMRVILAAVLGAVALVRHGAADARVAACWRRGRTSSRSRSARRRWA